MSLSRRRDPQVVDTVELAADTPQYTFVDRAGAIAAANADAFGITMESGDLGDPVPVTRLGFCPVRVVTAANADGEKIELVVAANGLTDTAPAAGGGETFVVAITEEEAAADGAQVGAWVDCVSAGRNRTIPA